MECCVTHKMPTKEETRKKLQISLAVSSVIFPSNLIVIA